MPSAKPAKALGPLADPKRAPFVRAALNRKKAREEREALEALRSDPVRHAKTVARLRELQQLLED